MTDHTQTPIRWTFSALIFVILLMAASLLVWPGRNAQAKTPAVYTGLVAGVAVGGYDAVAYFAEKKPVKGSKEFSLMHDGVVWLFASAANRDAFKADPAKFTPQYGGYCAYAVSQGYTAKGDPQAWSIVGGRLFLNYDKSVRSSWEKASSTLIPKSDANWPKVLNK